MENNIYSNPFNPKKIDRTVNIQVIVISLIILIGALITAWIIIMLFPFTVDLPTIKISGESKKTINWNLLEGIASTLTVGTIAGGGVYTLMEHRNKKYKEIYSLSQSNISVFQEVNDRFMNSDATAARRWIILNLPIRQDNEDDQSWLKRTIAALDNRPRGWKGDRPPGREYLKEVLNGLDFIGFVAKHYWNMENEIIKWLSPPVTKVWERIYLYVEYEAEQRNEPDFYESARDLGHYCVEWRKKSYPKSNIIKGAT